MSRSTHPTERERVSKRHWERRNHDRAAKKLDELGKKIFAECVSPDRSLEEELKETNSGLLYIYLNEEVVGYVLTVKESCRRQGHGEELLKSTIEKCRSRSIQRISLNVESMNTAATSLYKKFGFQVESLIKSYYSSDRDSYRMYLDFDQKDVFLD